MSSAHNNNLLTTHIPMDVWAEVALQMLHVRDLMAIAVADAWPGMPIGAVYVAKYNLTEYEMRWFAEHGVSIELFAARYTLTKNADVMYHKGLRNALKNHRFLSSNSFPLQLCTLNGRLHSIDDLPAVIHGNGVREWFSHGELHRENDLPAIVRSDAEEYEWYFRGKQHRDGGRPAVEYAGDSREWYFHGVLHRDGGLPAIEWKDGGERSWWVHGKRHRDGGLPAVEWSDGKREWWVHGKRHREDLPVIEWANSECGWICCDGTFLIQRANGDREWHEGQQNNTEESICVGVLHRHFNDLPAVERANGDREWFYCGKLHRENDLPAIERANGDREWWMHGELFRSGGRLAIERGVVA